MLYRQIVFFSLLNFFLFSTSLFSLYLSLSLSMFFLFNPPFSNLPSYLDLMMKGMLLAHPLIVSRYIKLIVLFYLVIFSLTLVQHYIFNWALKMLPMISPRLLEHLSTLSLNSEIPAYLNVFDDALFLNITVSLTLLTFLFSNIFKIPMKGPPLMEHDQHHMQI